MDPTDWKYLAEGGANIVFRYEGLLDEFVSELKHIYTYIYLKLDVIVPEK